MRTRIQKWGNSLALRIPKSFADEVQLDRGSLVELSLADGKLLISSVKEEERITLEQLLAGVTEENLHSELGAGEAVGNEIW